MAQKILNSSDNINQPHNVSIWFQRDYTGLYLDLGDLVVDGVSLTPEFAEFRSYRNGINALRKKFLTNRAAQITATLNEPNIQNFERVVFGTTPTSGDSVTVYEGKHLEVQSDGTGEYIDLADAGESDFSACTVKGIYETTDILLASNLISSDLTADTDGKVYFDATDIGVAVGDTVYVRYEVAYTGMYSTTIYGAENTTVEGAARLQARNLQGGVVQIWELASVNLAPNGDLSYPVDAVQTVPILMTLQERSGTFGKVYTK